MSGRFSPCLLGLARRRDAIGTRKHVSEKHLQDLVRKTLIDINLPTASFDLLFQFPNGLVHTHSFRTEAPSELREVQLFYRGWSALPRLVSGNEGRGGEIACHVEHCGENVRECVDGDQKTNPFRTDADGEEERR